MVTQQILVLLFQVRILVAQPRKEIHNAQYVWISFCFPVGPPTASPPTPSASDSIFSQESGYRRDRPLNKKERERMRLLNACILSISRLPLLRTKTGNDPSRPHRPHARSKPIAAASCRRASWASSDCLRPQPSSSCATPRTASSTGSHRPSSYRYPWQCARDDVH